MEIDFINNEFDNINKHMGEVYNELQRAEKEADMLYTVRRILHLSVTDDIDAAGKILNNMMLSLDKEYYSLNS
jgi:galactokinase